MTLDEIALSCDPIPDKASNGHGYTKYYARHFDALRDQPLKVLEIGVWEGASLQMWAKYFPKATIVGADINIERCKRTPEHCRLWQADQSSTPSLVNMAEHLGPWDIIIDDGSHNPEHQILSFEALWPYVRVGGIYAIEDLHPNYTSYKDSPRRAVAFIGGVLQDDLHGRGKTAAARLDNVAPIEKKLLTGRELEIDEIHIYRYMAVIHHV